MRLCCVLFGLVWFGGVLVFFLELWFLGFLG